MGSIYRSTPIEGIKSLVKAIAWMLTGVLIAGIGFYVKTMRARPDLQAWHEHELSEEYRAGNPDANLKEYLEREERLFAQLEREIFQRVEQDGPDPLNRNHPKSDLYPPSFDQDWNRSFELTVPAPRGGVLLLHGLSDSPYSMRGVAEIFAKQGFYVFALRIPGHGTIPGMLFEAEQEDWSAAVRLAALHVREQAGTEGDFFIGGYSNGAALSVEYALDSLEEPGLPSPDGLYLFSPALGVSRLAVLARWQMLLSKIPFLETLGWLDILPEYDPFKYNSFPTNAGYQVYRLTSTVSKKMERAGKSGRLEEFPPVLTFASVVDATVPIQAVITRLYNHLPENGSELVLFDVNRESDMQQFINTSFEVGLKTTLEPEDLNYSVTLITNRTPDTSAIMARTRASGASSWREEPFSSEWPQGVYSLSHVAIPFPPDDPLYGPNQGDNATLGGLEPRGERGVLNVPITQLMRLRYNPFFDYVAARLNQE